MVDTPPQTAAGLAIMLAAAVYRMEATAAGSHFHDPDSWYFDGAGGLGRILPALWRSPAAAELFRYLPADHPAICQGRRERSIEASHEALVEAEARPYEPIVAEVRRAMIASEAAGKPISEDEAVAMLRVRGRRDAA